MRFWGIDPDMDRRRLQALRADPPARATSGTRRRVFGAALEQWDALHRASAEVVPAASPILLFYALSQAGRAVCAAMIPGRPFQSRGHGLRIGDPTGDIGATPIVPEGGANTSFAMFCRATGSAGLTGATTLGALWAANPKLDVAPTLGEHESRALELIQISGDPPTRVLISGELARGLPENEQDAARQLSSRMTSYPEVGSGLVVSNSSPRISRDGAPQVEVGWRNADGTAMAVDLVVSGYGRPNSGVFLRPSLNAENDILEYLPLWWATLLAVSSLARTSRQGQRDRAGWNAR